MLFGKKLPKFRRPSTFQNLIENAIQYPSERALRVRISCEDAGGQIQVSVEDSGIGIAANRHEKTFSAFKRLHGNTIPGTGIGLAICQRILERYGGWIWVESELGRGTRFLFVVPNESWKGRY